MARDKALYAGHPVAAVAATSAKIAADALKLIEVDYEVLPWVIDVDEALQPGAPILHEHMRDVGAKPGPGDDIQYRRQARAQAGRLSKPASPLPRSSSSAASRPSPCIRAISSRTPASSSVAKDGQATIWSSSQGHFMVRDMTAQLTGAKLSDIRAIPAEIGGGFGGKTIVYLEPLALVLSRKSGRPVKMVMTREEVFRATGPTSGSSSTVKIGATKDGKITAVKATMPPAGRRLPGLAHPRRRGLRALALRPRQRADHRLRHRHQPAQGGGLSRARRADRRVRRGVHARRTGRGPEDGPARAAPEERGQRGHQSRPMARPSAASATRRRLQAALEPSALQGAARVRTRAAASPAASGSTPAANPARRSTSTRTAPWW